MNLKMCLNPKVLGGLAVIAVGLFVFAPQAALGALPVLLALACPLSMAVMALFMGKGMQGMAGAQAGGGASYTCPMHPQVQSATPGLCPSCGMALVPGAAPATVTKAPAGTVLTTEERRTRLQAQLQEAQDRQTALTRELAEVDQAPVPSQNGWGNQPAQAVPEPRHRGEGA